MRQNRNIPIKRKPIFAIIVDGECEVWYIQMLKRNEKEIKVDLKPEIPQKKKLAEQFKMVKEYAKDYDKVFWIIDFDVIVSETQSAKKGKKTSLQEFKEYFDNLKKISNVVIIINNPCLEYWFLLHFEATSKYFENYESLIKQVKKHKFLADYEKTKEYFTKQDNDIYLKLKPFLSKAKANAKKLGEFDFNNPQSAMSQMQLLFDTEVLNLSIEEKNR